MIVADFVVNHHGNGIGGDIFVGAEDAVYDIIDRILVFGAKHLFNGLAHLLHFSIQFGSFVQTGL